MEDTSTTRESIYADDEADSNPGLINIELKEPDPLPGLRTASTTTIPGKKETRIGTW